MAYLIVVSLSLFVGASVYLITLSREQGRRVAAGFGHEDGGEAEAERGGETLPPPPAGTAYLRVSTLGPSWGDRIQGLVGLVMLIGVGAAVLALGIYQLGHLINQTIERFLR